MATPSPQTWTLRFKARKTTVVLHVDPLNTFPTIKSYLYDALRDTDLKDPDTNASVALPDSPSDIQLGRLVDIHDSTRGFQVGEWELPDYEEEDVKGKGKAKAGKKGNGPATVGVGGAKDCPKGAGLKDGAVLAFRWAGDGVWDGSDDTEIEQDETAGGNMWRVKLASFEDAYGAENETDVGAEREFEG